MVTAGLTDRDLWIPSDLAIEALLAVVAHVDCIAAIL